MLYNVTLIATKHLESGVCNPDELYKILEEINPELIFDELPADYFDRYYNDSFDRDHVNKVLLNQPSPEVPLEVRCIRKYRQTHNIKILPVDVDVRQQLAKYRDEIIFMFSIFFENEDYKQLDTEKDISIIREGFHYLNSQKFLYLLERKEILEKKIIESSVQKERLNKIYKLHAAQQDYRENIMLENIYNFSKENQYDQAVLLIGAEHKKSIMHKIAAYEKLPGIKLNWKMYNELQ